MTEKPAEEIPVPSNDVIGSISGDEAVAAAVEELVNRGIPRDHIRVFKGEEAERELEEPAAGGPLGWLARLVRSTLSESGKFLEEYSRAASSGATIIAVHIDDSEQVDLVSDVLISHHAANVRFFGRFVITDKSAPSDEHR